MRLIRSTLYLLWLAVTLIPWTSMMVLVSLVIRGKPLYALAVIWCRYMALGGARWLLGIRYRVHGIENLPQDPRAGAVVLSKHQSAIETFLLPIVMPHQLSYVLKRELLRIPFFGWGLARLDVIPIDRSLRGQASTKLAEHGKPLLDQGIWVAVFPEGTRIPRGQKGEYKLGGARLAVQTGVPVIPVALNSARVWPRNAFIKKPGVIDVSIGPLIQSTGREPKALMQEAQAWIEAEMRRIDPEAYP
ncbi:MAG: 1-acyl-sn-glycerol-3-phosphate acyltransferase [Burkholderiaceae bacterium]|jgi:1-acyl-sn-glycerol-3-phosphate acyltransferase|nr:1-acyl-sn-glycerol-3-phosphate acyltransferase [Burkholderiaceae bacterium]